MSHEGGRYHVGSIMVAIVVSTPSPTVRPVVTSAFSESLTAPPPIGPSDKRAVLPSSLSAAPDGVNAVRCTACSLSLMTLRTKATMQGYLAAPKGHDGWNRSTEPEMLSGTPSRRWTRK